MERGRERQGMVPDFMVELPSHTGGKTRKLAELKVINCCSTRYSPGQRGKAVDRRANLLQGEYRRKAREVDRIAGGRDDETLGQSRGSYCSLGIL